MNTTFLKLSNLFLITISAFVFSGCFSSGDGVPYYTISDEFAGYCMFEEGSWWYYQNDSTQVTDTVRIDDVNISNRFNPENIDYNYEAVEMFISSEALDITKYELTAGDYEAETTEMNSLFRIYFGDETYQHVFSPQYTIGEDVILGDDIGVYTNVEVLNNMIVNGNSYSDIWHSRRIVSVTKNAEYNYWIAKNYGLIKFTTEIEGVTSSVSLVSSKPIQEED